jgi:hypothetical protein
VKLTEEQRNWLKPYSAKVDKRITHRVVWYLVLLQLFAVLIAAAVMYVHALQYPVPDWAVNVLSFASYLLLLALLAGFGLTCAIAFMVCYSRKMAKTAGSTTRTLSHSLLMDLAAARRDAYGTKHWYDKPRNYLLDLVLAVLIFTYAAAGWPIRATLVVLCAVGVHLLAKLCHAVVEDYITTLTAEEYAARDPEMYAKIVEPVQRERQINMGT